MVLPNSSVWEGRIAISYYPVATWMKTVADWNNHYWEQNWVRFRNEKLFCRTV